VAREEEKLKLGKGVAFVKSQLRRLRQEDDTWEADFFPIPCSDSEHPNVWFGMVLSHGHDYVLAQRTVEEPPTVNDLARLLADAMQRPMAKRCHRPRCLYLRSKPEWACPPEDCGGPWGYSDFLETLKNPDHKSHDEMLEGIGGGFDPEAFDIEAVNKELATLR